MDTNVECDGCGLVLMAIEALGPTPVGHDDCPGCGGTEFSFLH